MRGVSRRTISAVVGDTALEGLLQWRYGRVTPLDIPALQTVTHDCSDRLVQRPAQGASKLQSG